MPSTYDKTNNWTEDDLNKKKLIIILYFCISIFSNKLQLLLAKKISLLQESATGKYFFFTAPAGLQHLQHTSFDANLGKHFKSQNNWFVILAGDRKSQAPCCEVPKT